jgi:hypothetical protein
VADAGGRRVAGGDLVRWSVIWALVTAAALVALVFSEAVVLNGAALVAVTAFILCVVFWMVERRVSR